MQRASFPAPFSESRTHLDVALVRKRLCTRGTALAKVTRLSKSRQLNDNLQKESLLVREACLLNVVRVEPAAGLALD